MTNEEKMLSKGYHIINFELNNLINDQSLIQRYLWYSMGEIIIQSAPGSGNMVAYGADVCGSMMTLLTGNNFACSRIIHTVHDSDIDYEETLNRMQISENIQDVGDVWKGILKSRNIDELVNMSNTLKKYRTCFLPNIKNYIKFWNKNNNENYNKKAMDIIIKDKSNAIKQFTNITDGYIEIIKL